MGLNGHVRQTTNITSDSETYRTFPNHLLAVSINVLIKHTWNCAWRDSQGSFYSFYFLHHIILQLHSISIAVSLKSNRLIGTHIKCTLVWLVMYLLSDVTGLIAALREDKTGWTRFWENGGKFPVETNQQKQFQVLSFRMIPVGQQQGANWRFHWRGGNAGRIHAEQTFIYLLFSIEACDVWKIRKGSIKMYSNAACRIFRYFSFPLWMPFIYFFCPISSFSGPEARQSLCGCGPMCFFGENNGT